MAITSQLQSDFDKLPCRMGFAMKTQEFLTGKGIHSMFWRDRKFDWIDPLVSVQNFAETVNMLIELWYMNPQEAGVLWTDTPSSRNFSIWSAWWEEAQFGRIPYQVFRNPQRDILEFRFKGKDSLQFFRNREAALRETAKLRRRIPTDAQWENIIKSGWRPQTYPGYASRMNGKIFKVGTVWYFSADSDNIFWFSEDEQEVKKHYIGYPLKYPSEDVGMYSVCCLEDALL